MSGKTCKHLWRAVLVKYSANFLAVLLAVSRVSGGVARAQLSGTGAISGTVQDTSGAVVPGAKVTATNVNTAVSTERVSTDAGDYNITPLIPGIYMVTVTAQGFEGFTQQNITVDALSTVSVNVKLTVGRESETVTVSSAPPMLSTTDATLGGVMDNEMYSNLPLMMGQGNNNDQRRSTDFEYLMPGVQANYTSNNSTDNSGIINGSGPKGGVSDIYIEGVDLPTADQVGDPRFTWTAISVDAVNQFQVQTAGYSAQYAGQGVENFSVKTGGNTIHGSLYEYLRNTVLDAWNFTNKVPTLNATGVLVPGGIKPKEIQNEFGLDLSGPIIKDKLFLFINYGQYRNQNGAVYSAQTIPTAAMLGMNVNGTQLGYADFTGYAAANPGYHVYDLSRQTNNCTGTATSPCTRPQFDGLKNGVPTFDVISGSRISQAAAYINQFYVPFEQLTDQGAYTGNINYGTPTGLSNWYDTNRLDYNESAKNQIALIVAFGRQASTGPNSSGTKQLGPPFNTSQSYHPDTNVDILKDTYTINPHVVNQAAFGFGRYSSVSVTPNDAPIYNAASLGLVNTPAGQASGGFPEINFSGGQDSPAKQAGYAWNSKINNTYTTTDNLQWQIGKHNFTFGGQFVDTQYNYYSALGPTGPMNYTFSSNQTAAFTSQSTATPGIGTALNGSTGSSVASYVLGAASSASVEDPFVPGLGTRWRDPSFWGQDDYKVNDKLTLNIGLRWDIFPPVQEAHNLFTFFNPRGVNSVTGNMGTLQFAGNGDPALYSNSRSPSPVFWRNIAPRLGLAYSVDPKTVIRASYDMAFARGNWTSGSQSGSPSTLGLTPTAAAPASLFTGYPAIYWDNTACTNGSANGVNCGFNGLVTAPTPPAGGTSLAEYGTGETAALGTKTAATMTYFDPYLGSRTPEFINWTVGLQRSITQNMVLTLSYVGSEGHFVAGGYNSPTQTNKLTENYAALAGYNVSSGTAVPCSGTSCTSPLLTQKATAANLALAAGLGFKVPNPYTNGQSYLASNSVYQYYVQYPQFSGMNNTTNFSGNTSFNALELSLNQRMAHGLDFMVNYTYSKSIDDVGTMRVYDNARLDRSLSATDEPQNLTATVVYQSPFGKGKMGGDNFLVRALASDWNLSGIGVYHSGYPLLFTGGGCAGSSILDQCMPNVVPGQGARINGSYGRPTGGITANGANKFSTVQHFNPAAFSVNVPGTASAQQVSVGQGPAAYIPGNAARSAADGVFGMGYYDVDMGLKRLFPIYQQWTLQVEADMSNVTNHTVWASPSGAVANSSYGLITGTANGYAPRHVQLAARVNW